MHVTGSALQVYFAVFHTYPNSPRIPHPHLIHSGTYIPPFDLPHRLTRLRASFSRSNCLSCASFSLSSCCCCCFSFSFLSSSSTAALASSRFLRRMVVGDSGRPLADCCCCCSGSLCGDVSSGVVGSCSGLRGDGESMATPPPSSSPGLNPPPA